MRRIKRHLKDSFGFYLILVQSWVLFNVDSFFPNQSDQWFPILTRYLILQVSIIALPDLKYEVFEYKFGVTFARIMLWFVGSLLFFSLLGSFLVTINPIKNVVLTGTTILILFVHGFYVSVIEEMIFRDYIAEKKGHNVANIIFAVFHWTVLNFNILALVLMYGLGWFFSLIKLKFSPKTNVANIGVHWGWNIFSTIIRAVRG